MKRPIRLSVVENAMLSRRVFNRFLALSPLAAWPSETGSQSSASAVSSAEEPGALEVRQVACGALLRDNFNAPSLDTNVWLTQSLDPGLSVSVQNGEVVLRGTSARIPEDTFHKDASALCRYVGIYSPKFPQVDVCLAARVRMPSGISAEPGDHTVGVHLCGLLPDCYSEVLFGKFDAKTSGETWNKYGPPRLRNASWQDARGWWFAIVNQDPGRPVYRVSGTPLPERGDERERFYDTLVDYDEPTRLSRGFLKIGDRWVQLGEAETVIRGISRIELKLRNLTPLYGAYREARFDDCRLYPNPRRHPIRFVVVQEGEMPYRAPALRVALYTYDGTHKVSESYTDQFGITYLPVNDLAWVAFPVSASVRIFRGEQEIASARMEARDVQGLYPGDVWSFDLSQARRKQ